MRLTRLQVTNHRSLFGERVDIDLAPGLQPGTDFSCQVRSDP